MHTNKHAHSFSKPCLWCGAEIQSWYGCHEIFYCSGECKKAMRVLRRRLRSIGLDIDFRHMDSRTTGNIRSILERSARQWLATKL